MTNTETGAYKAALEQVQNLLQDREYKLALEQVDAILDVHPRDAKTNFMRAVVLRHLGRLDESVALLQALAKATTGVAAVQQELGITLHALGRIDDAVDALQAALAINPKLATCWRLLGQCLLAEGEEDSAEHAARQALIHSHTHPGIVKALELVADEHYGMAEGICRDYLQRHPDDVSVIRLLAEIGIKLGVRDDPVILLEDCLKIAPHYHLARNTYASALGQAQRYEEALKEIDYLEQVEPRNLSHKVLAASLEVMVGNFEKAEQRYEKILARVPNHAQLQNSHGHALKTLGKQSDAIAAYRRAINLRPSMGDAYWNLANMKTFEFSDAEVEQMRAQISQENAATRDHYHLCFALGKALEDRRQYEESFHYYQLGNELRCKEEGYQAEQTQAETEALIKHCTPDLFVGKEDFGCPDPDPIFIVGLPRSGSTLLEQILASHSQVDGTSELREIIVIARRLGGKRNRDDESLYPGILWDLTAEQCRELGEEYIERTRIQRGAAPFFIDKMPNNFQHVSLIKLILPNAKIIDARRHPMACCFSGFKQLFAAGQAFTYSQSDMARYYSDYARLMEHWDEVLPGAVLRVKYESVVADIETQVRRLLDYCGLPFEEACLSFHATERAIRTASSEQVRRPIYNDALEQWQHFAPHLEEMRGTLTEWIERHEVA